MNRRGFFKGLFGAGAAIGAAAVAKALPEVPVVEPPIDIAHPIDDLTALELQKIMETAKTPSFADFSSLAHYEPYRYVTCCSTYAGYETSAMVSASPYRIYSSNSTSAD